MKVLMEEQVIPPVRIFLKLHAVAEGRAPPLAVPQEQGREPAGEIDGDLPESFRRARAGRVLDLIFLAEIVVKSLQCFNHEEVQRQPHRTTPVRIAAE